MTSKEKRRKEYYPFLEPTGGKQAQCCPVCCGSGEIEKDFEEIQEEQRATGWRSKDRYKHCHGCGGSGWVSV